MCAFSPPHAPRSLAAGGFFVGCAGAPPLSQTGYSKYETGENDIPTRVLIRLAALCHTTTDYLLGISDRRDLPE